jgi:hypothetical protein
MPVVLGVIAGLLVGAAAGYWWGARQASPVAAPVASVATAVPEAQPVSEPALNPPQAPAAAAATPQAGPAPVPAEAAPRTTAPAPAPPAAASPAVPAVKTGSITVRSTPSRANVFLGGKARGVTPRSLAKLPLGTYTIRVTRSGYQAQEKTVTITAADPNARISFTLVRPAKPAAPKPPSAPPKPADAAVAGPPPTPSPLEQAAQAAQAARAASGVGVIEIDTRPQGARVRLDGKDAGVSPVVLNDVKEGAHTVRLELEGFRIWSTTVSVKAGTRTRIAASLERSATR